jgi:hypothetical protein
MRPLSIYAAHRINNLLHIADNNIRLIILNKMA